MSNLIGFIGNQCHFDTSLVYDIVKKISWIELPAMRQLYAAVRGHADMICCPVGDRMVVEPSVHKQLCSSHPEIAHKLISGETPLGRSYPENIAYNVLFIGQYAIHNTEYTDPVLSRYIDEAGYIWVHTKQGYSNCACLAVAERAAITADAGLAKTLRKHGIEVLEIEQGHIDLPGLNYGFVGGASFTIEDRIYFLGDLHEHPSGKVIQEFIEAHGIEVVSIGHSKLHDIGSVRFI